MDGSKAVTTTICGGAKTIKDVKCAAVSEIARPCGGGTKTIDDTNMDSIGFPRQVNCKQRVSSWNEYCLYRYLEFLEGKI